MAVVPLPIYPHKPTGKVLDLIRQAKQKLAVDFQVQPVDAVPGSPGRVLALQETPNFLCDHALVQNLTVESLTAALAYVLELNDDPRGVTVRRMLTEIFGGEVREVTN